MYKVWVLGCGESTFATNGLDFDTIEDFHDTQGTRVAAEYSRTSASGNSVADRLRALGLLSTSDRTSPDTGTSTYRGTGNPFLDGTPSPTDREPDDPGADPDDENTTEDEPNPMLD